MKIEVKTSYNKDMIVLETNMVNDDPLLSNMVTKISRDVIILKENKVREALVALGWTPPQEETGG